MLARYSHISKEKDIYENHRSKPYKETEIGVRVNGVLRSQAVYAEMLPNYPTKGGWPLLQIHCRGTFIITASVNRWVNRYLASGMDVLRNKPEQGAKRIMDNTDTQAVIDAIERDRLSVMKAKERWEEATGKKACRSTFRSFLSALAQDLDV